MEEPSNIVKLEEEIFFLITGIADLCRQVTYLSDTEQVKCALKRVYCGVAILFEKEEQLERLRAETEL